MAIKVRCTECGEMFTVDEAFGGGMSRCPHCGASVLVEPAGKKPPQERPQSPARQDEEGEEVAGQEERDDTPETPENNPFRHKYQNVFSIVILLVLAAMVIGAVTVLLLPPSSNPATQPSTPAATQPSGQ
jgi:DNA-directed RNA polymerase subunit RPC12/RpoP